MKEHVKNMDPYIEVMHNINMVNLIEKSHTKLKPILVSETNYLKLKRLGGAGDSFNDVLTELLGKKGDAI